MAPRNRHLPAAGNSVAKPTSKLVSFTTKLWVLRADVARVDVGSAERGDGRGVLAAGGAGRLYVDWLFRARSTQKDIRPRGE